MGGSTTICDTHPCVFLGKGGGGQREGEGRYILISTVRVGRCSLPYIPSHTHTHTHTNIFLAVRWDGKEFSTVKELLDHKPVIGEEFGNSGDTLVMS